MKKLIVPFVFSLIGMVMVSCGKEDVKPSFAHYTYDDILQAPQPFQVTYDFISISNADESDALERIELANRKQFFMLDSSLEESPKMLIQRSLNELREEYKCDEYPLVDTFVTTAHAAVTEKDNYLSYSITRYEYLGGAHGMEYEVCSVYDMNDGSKLHLNDLFNADDLIRVNDMLVEDLCRQLEMPEVDLRALANMGFYPEEIKAGDNFRIGKSGIDFLFNPYSIGCYAVGRWTLHIPYEKLEEMLLL